MSDPPDKRVAQTPQPAKQKRWRRPLLISLVAFAIVIVAGVLTLRSIGASRIEAELAAIEERGEPMDIDGLVALLDKPSEAQREARWMFEDAFEKLKLTDDEIPMYVGLTPLSPEALQIATSLVNKRQDSLSILERAINTGPIYWPDQWNDSNNGFSVQLGAMMTTAEILILQAEVDCSQGNLDEAVHALRLAWALSDLVDDKPYYMIDHMVRIAVKAFVAQRVERTVNLVVLNDVRLNELAGLIEWDSVSEDITRMLIAERQFGWNDFQNQLEFLADFDPDDNPFGRMPADFSVGYYRAMGLWSMDKAAYLNHWAQIIQISRQPFHQAWREMHDYQFDRSGFQYMYTHVSESMLLAPARAITLTGRVLANIRLAQLAIAIERFRVAQRRLPATLNEVAPRFIDTIPADPFTGKPLIYRKNDSGYILYSVGDDAIDHGGRKFNDDGEEYEPGSDIVFQVIK